MPLVLSNLIAGLTSVFQSRSPDGMTAAQLIAVEYDKYCRTAMAPPGIPILTGAGIATLANILGASLASPNGSAQSVAKAYSDGILAYWLLPPVAFVGGPATGIATAMPGAVSAIPSIVGALSNTKNTEASAAQQIATALDVATRTVLVVYSTPPPPAGPPPPALVM